ncbi:MAG TPA: hypothetical protein VMW73_03895 [Spirochaetia bacterium]|nr:hypothetical protein [Spirochaetia bacterium]
MKIEELTSKIYEEGVAKAKAQEEDLLVRARKEAEKLVSDAKAQAAAIVETAKTEAEQLRARVAGELRMAGEQAVGELQNRVTDALVDNTLPASVSAAMQDTSFVRTLIQEVVGKWDVAQTSIDLAVILPESTQKEMVQFFGANARELLDRGLELTFSSEVKSGFQIRPKDGSYRLSFQNEDFVWFFRSFLRERTRELLFGNSEQTQTGQGQ